MSFGVRPPRVLMWALCGAAGAAIVWAATTTWAGAPAHPAAPAAREQARDAATRHITETLLSRGDVAAVQVRYRGADPGGVYIDVAPVPGTASADPILDQAARLVWQGGALDPLPGLWVQVYPQPTFDDRTAGQVYELYPQTFDTTAMVSRYGPRRAPAG